MSYSIQRAVSDGTLSSLALSIQYYSRNDISVYLGNVLWPVNTVWSWVGATGSTIKFKDPVPSGIEVMVKRVTDVSDIRHNFSQGAQFTSGTLDDNFKQMLFVAQEAQEGGRTITDVFGDIDMHGFKVRNMGAATELSGAAQLAQAGGGSTGNTPGITYQPFTGDGVTAAFPLTSSSLSMFVFVGGVYQQSAGWGIAGANLVFSEAPPKGVAIEVLSLGTVGSSARATLFESSASIPHTNVQSAVEYVSAKTDDMASGLPGSRHYNLQSKLADMETTARADFGAVSFSGNSASEADIKYDATDSMQRMFASQYHSLAPLQIGHGYFSVGNLMLGDPATADYTSPSGQKLVCSMVRGRGWSLSAFFARAGKVDANKPLVRANGGAGVLYENFAGYGRGLVSTVFDFAWRSNPPGMAAPSNQCAFKGLYADGGKVVGINFDNVYDSLIENCRVVNSPIACRLVSGGGQVQVTNCTFSGLTQVSSQNLSIRDSGLFGGLDINGNSENRVALYNTQVFYIGLSGVSASIPSYKYNYAINADDSGTYGASIVAENCSFFARGHCISGKFALGMTATNCVFDYDRATGQLLYNIVAGLERPMFRFVNCNMPLVGSPLGTNPDNYDWEIVNCVVGGKKVAYASNLYEGNWTPTGNGIALTVNGQSTWRRFGNNVVAVCDITVPTTTDTNPMFIDGLPAAKIVGTSSVYTSFCIGPAFAIGGYVDKGIKKIVLAKIGGPNPAITNASVSTARLMLRIEYSVAPVLLGYN